LGILIFFVLITSHALETITSVSVSNIGPTVESVYLNDTALVLSDDFTTAEGNGIYPTPNGVTTFYVNGTVSDPNGVGTDYDNGDISNVQLSFHTSDDCLADKNNCYIDAECELGSQVSQTEIKYYCEVQLASWADSTRAGGAAVSIGTWEAEVIATDHSGATDENTKNVEVELLLSLDVPSSIDYGIRTRGSQSTSENNAEMILTQQGNDQADVMVYGTAMPCSVLGSIATGNQEWALSDVEYGNTSSIDLTASAPGVETEILIDYRTNES
jgi:hypothetical protein